MNGLGLETLTTLWQLKDGELEIGPIKQFIYINK